MSPIPSISFLLSISAAAAASDASALPPAPTRVAVPSPSVPEIETASFVQAGELPDQLCFDVDADGTVWVRGRTYKASFGASGATYIPFLGSDAPGNYPVALSLANARVGEAAIELSPARGASREGTTIRIDRGTIDEVYELSLDSIEQTFVVEQRPVSGGLRLQVALETELTSEQTDDGVELSNEHGGVRYGRAFLRESDGTRTAIESRLVSGVVEIEVGAEQMARATFPLVVDPIVSTFTINGASASHFEVDVSYDLTTNRIATVYNEQFSATDFDVVSQLSSSSGTLVSRVYVDLTSENWWGPPRIANLNAADQFLVVGTANNVLPFTASSIFGRTIQAADHTMSPKFVIAGSTSNGNRRNCDVGSDPYDGALAYYCVVWEHQYGSSSDSDIEARLVTRDATLQTAVVALTTNFVADEEYPRISKSNGFDVAEARWNIGWHGNFPASLGDIFGAQIRWDGTLVTPRFPVSTIPVDEAFVSVSPPAANGRFVAAWLHSEGTHNDIHAALIGGSTIFDTIDVTTREGAGNALEDQRDVEVDTDGTRFLLVYNESVGGSSFNHDVYATSLYSLPASQIEVFAAHQPIDTTSSSERTPTLASRHNSGSSGSRRFYVAWNEFDVAGGPGDVFGALYDNPVGGPVTGYCFGDGTNPTACPCGNVGITGHGCANSVQSDGGLLTHTGDAGLSADTLRLHVQGLPPNSTCTFFQGTAGNSPGTPFGDGVRCTAGTVIRLKTIPASPGGQASYPTGTDPDISVTGAIAAGGDIRYYQVNYRNAATFCTSATFNITNGLRAVWLP